MSWKIIVQAMNDVNVEFPESNGVEIAEHSGILLSENDTFSQNTNNQIDNPHLASSHEYHVLFNIPQQLSAQCQEGNETILLEHDIQDAYRSNTNTSIFQQNFPQCNLTRNHLFPFSNRVSSSKTLDETSGSSMLSCMAPFKSPPTITQQSCLNADNEISQPEEFPGTGQISQVNEKYFMEANMIFSHPPILLHTRNKQREQNNVNLNNKNIKCKKELLNARPFKCDSCTKTFSQKTNLLRHYRTHRGEKPFKCETCTKAFTQKSNLIVHNLTHTGEKPFKCETCTQAFTKKKDLLRHNRIHTGEKPFMCGTCTQAFTRKSSMVRHYRVHTGEKPFNCETCTQSFKQKHHLVRHIQTHIKRRHSKVNYVEAVLNIKLI